MGGKIENWGAHRISGGNNEVGEGFWELRVFAFWIGFRGDLGFLGFPEVTVPPPSERRSAVLGAGRVTLLGSAGLRGLHIPACLRGGNQMGSATPTRPPLPGAVLCSGVRGLGRKNLVPECCREQGGGELPKEAVVPG